MSIESKYWKFVSDGVKPESARIFVIPISSNTFKPFAEIEIPAPYSLICFDLSNIMVLIPWDLRMHPAVRPAIPPPIIPI